jgi:hypothetical protein
MAGRRRIEPDKRCMMEWIVDLFPAIQRPRVRSEGEVPKGQQGGRKEEEMKGEREPDQIGLGIIGKGVKEDRGWEGIVMMMMR